MLSRLLIKNVGIIEETDVLFEDGFSVLTGETGAGKSMLMDALSLALGARGDKSLIRHGADMATVEAEFDISECHPVHKILEEQCIDADEGHVTLRRVIAKDKTRNFICGVNVTLSVMKKVGDQLADIHGQHDHQMMLNSSYHAEMLDHFGRLNSEVDSVRHAYDVWKEVYNRYQNALDRARSGDDEAILLKAYVQELEGLNPQVGEEETLTDERKILMSGEKIVSAFALANEALNGEADVVNLIASAESSFSSLGENVPAEVRELIQRLSEISIEISDIARDIERLGNSFEPDPERLQQVDDRLFSLKDCARKHHCTVDELPEMLEKLHTRLDELENLSDVIEELNVEQKSLRKAFEVSCQNLTEGRAKASAQLAIDVSEALGKLHMPNARFSPSLVAKNPEDWNDKGAEKIEFMVTTNAGSPMQPLVKIASGGEVSRLMLALKEVFYRTMPETTLIFDEVDTGVGGRVADSMGAAMKEISQRHQVMAITHLPQVASWGGTHIRITKKSEEDKTHTQLDVLTGKERVDELARMLSGKDVTAEAEAAAKSMLRASGD